MSNALKGKVAIVTGGASGIGEAITRRYVAEGAQVCVLGRSEDRLAILQEELGEAIITFCGDVRNLNDNVEVVKRTVEVLGKLDIFVSNAGVFDGFVSLEQLPEDKIDEAFSMIFDINVKGFLHGAKASFQELRKTKGTIIGTLSNSAFYPNGGGPIYTASKHALVGLIKELAFELAPNIRVNGVSPGGTLTNIAAIPPLKECVQKLDPAERENLIRRRNPLQIAQTPEDHMGAYVLLASNEARAMTGTIIESDGGLGVRGMPLADLEN